MKFQEKCGIIKYLMIISVQRRFCKYTFCEDKHDEKDRAIHRSWEDHAVYNY